MPSRRGNRSRRSRRFGEEIELLPIASGGPAAADGAQFSPPAVPGDDLCQMQMCVNLFHSVSLFLSETGESGFPAPGVSHCRGIKSRRRHLPLRAPGPPLLPSQKLQYRISPFVSMPFPIRRIKKQETFSLRKTSPAIGNLLWDGLLHTRFSPAAFSAGSKAICCIPPPQAHPIFRTQPCRKTAKHSEKFARIADNQRLLNWGARRAALRPYFLRSFMRGSRVRKPAFLSTGRRLSSYCSSARERPWRIAPA